MREHLERFPRKPDGDTDAVERCAKIAEAMADNSERASSPYDGGSGSLGYEQACRDIAEAIRKSKSEE